MSLCAFTFSNVCCDCSAALLAGYQKIVGEDECWLASFHRAKGKFCHFLLHNTSNNNVVPIVNHNIPIHSCSPLTHHKSFTSRHSQVLKPLSNQSSILPTYIFLPTTTSFCISNTLIQQHHQSPSYFKSISICTLSNITLQYLRKSLCTNNVFLYSR